MNEKVKMGVALLIFGILAISIVFALQTLDIDDEEQEGTDNDADQVSNMNLITRTAGFCGAIFLIAGFIVILVHYNYNKSETS
ncbi:MAG: hypothetical protein R6W73_04440 [Candidatus Saliniplasma sp.]